MLLVNWLTIFIPILVSMEDGINIPSSEGRGKVLGECMVSRAPKPLLMPDRYSVVSIYNTSFNPEIDQHLP